MIQTNFVRRFGGFVPGLLLLSWGIVLAMLILDGLLIVQRENLVQTMPVLQKQIHKLQKRHASLDKQKTQLPPQAKLVALRQRVSVINSIVASKGRSISDILTGLESELPKNAWLVSLHHKRSEGELKLVAASGDVQPLTEFLRRLEADPHFSQALLTQQSHGRGKAKDTVQFEIRLVERAP